MQPGDVIQERYELEEIVGEGGMATVWRARDRRLGRAVAVKMLSERLAQDPEYMVRFFSEAQSVARVSNPHVIGILDFGQHDEHPYLVMECIEGGSAADLVGEPILPERAIEIVQEAASAAGSAHARGIVHRDIKPGNILLTRDGRVRLADFGIAKSDAAESMTATGQAVGSPHYISPEQVSSASASPASDVYSLGIVLFELLTGHKPFDGSSVTQIAIAHVDQEPPSPSEHVPDLDPRLERLVLRCLAKDPDERFADGRELAAALAGFAEGAAYVDEDGVGPVFLWRRPAVIGAAAVALTVAAVAAVFALGGLEGTTPAAKGETPAERERPKKRRPSPTPAAPATQPSKSPSPSPSPSPSERNERKGSRNTAGSGGETDSTEPSPSPSPTLEPTPSPTDGAETGETTGGSTGEATGTSTDESTTPVEAGTASS